MLDQLQKSQLIIRHCALPDQLTIGLRAPVSRVSFLDIPRALLF
jgi:hypothetical protein